MNNFPTFQLHKKELESVLSPENNQTNIELFATRSKKQSDFSRKLTDKGLDTVGVLTNELGDKINATLEEIEKIKSENPDLSNDPKLRPNLDFDIAKCVHSNLNISRSNSVNYDFWRWLNLNYFIENVRWRWVKDPDNTDKIRPNAKAVYGRGLGERDRRIDILRYWMIGERLYDRINSNYNYLDMLADKAKNSDGPFQDYINNLIDTNLYSPNENLIKKLGVIMLVENSFSTSKLVSSFKRYNTYRNRFLLEADEEILAKEICK